jgi:transposase
MGRKGISIERKLAAVEKYKRGEGSQDSIAQEHGVHNRGFQQCLANYVAMGTCGLTNVKKNSTYSVELTILQAENK